MGGGRGKHYGLPSGTSDIFLDNVKAARNEFPVDANGRFGEPGRRSSVQVLYAEDVTASAERLYRMLAEGGDEVRNQPSYMRRVTFPDGTHVTLRVYGQDKDPVIGINPATSTKTEGFMYKIHFEPKEAK